MLEKFGLDFRVVKTPAYFLVDNEPKIVDNKFVTVRTDTHTALGVVGATYNVVQNAEKFDVLLNAGNGIEPHAGYATKNGARVFMQFAMPEKILINGNDLVEGILTARGSHDGSCEVEIGLTAYRKRCKNGLWLAFGMGGDSKRIKAKHTSNVYSKLTSFSQILEMSLTQMKLVAKVFENMAEKRVSKEQVSNYLRNVFIKKDTTRSNNVAISALSFYENGIGQDGLEDTVWKAFNAATGFVQHEMFSKYQEGERLDSIIDGSIRRYNDEAFEQALLMIK